MKRFSFLASVAAALLLASCSSKTVGSDDAAKRLVAGEAPAFILSAKVKDLLDKGGISNKENIPMVAQMLFQDQVEYFTNPEKAGLDLTGKSYFAINVNGQDHHGWMLTKIKNQEDWEKTMKEEGNDRFEEIEGYNTVAKDDKMIMGWNDKLFIMVGTTQGKVKEKFKAYAAMIGEDKAPAAGFGKFFDTNTDLAFYSDYGQQANLQASMSHQMQNEYLDIDPEMIKKMSEKLKGSYGITTLQFENDKVVSDIYNNLTDQAKKEFSFIGSTGFPKELLSQLGSREITGFFTINTDVKKALEWVMSFTGKDDFLAEAREKSGLNVDRILGSIKGNVFVALQGIMKKPFPYKGEGMPDSIPVPRISVIASVNNNYLETVVDSLLKNKKEGNYYVLEKAPDAQYLAFKPQVAFYTNDARALTATGTPQLDAKAEEVLSKPFAFYLNIEQLLLGMNTSEKEKRIAGKFKYAYGGFDINGGHAELILNNGGKNSLWTLVNLGLESTADLIPSM